MQRLCDREFVVPLLRQFAKSLRPTMTVSDVARARIWDNLVERVQHDSDVLALALRSIEELARLVETNSIDAAKELAKARIVLAKR